MMAGSPLRTLLFALALPVGLTSCSESIGDNRLPLLFTVLASEDEFGVQGNAASTRPWVSTDGKWVVFQSTSTNLGSGDTNNRMDIFRKNLLTGELVRVSLGPAGVQGDGDSSNASISDDGNLVAFQSAATNFSTVPDGNGAVTDIFVRNISAQTTTLLSINTAGTATATGASVNPVISRNGAFVAFQSTAADLSAADANTRNDVFRAPAGGGAVALVSLNAAGVATANGFCVNPSISGDGRFIAYHSNSTDLVANDTNALQDVFRRDMTLTLNSSIRVSISAVDINGNANGVSGVPSISADGNRIAFESAATDLMAVPDANGVNLDIYVRDVTSAQTILASIHSNGTQGVFSSTLPSISADGLFVAFASGATNLVDDDTSTATDIFVRQLNATVPGTFTTVRVSVKAGGDEATLPYLAGSPSISGDGATVAFDSGGTDMVPGDNNGASDVFVRITGP